MNRDGACTSIWQTTSDDYEKSSFPENAIVDVVVIGAGLTGVTTALRLQRSGKTCIIAEAANAGFGTTGGTTAHLNTFYDTPYATMVSDFGEESARLMADGAKLAIRHIQSNCSEHQIDCALEDREGYLFALDEQQEKELQDIVEVSNRLGVNMEYAEDNPFPIPFVKLARVPGQAQFNPTQYLVGMLRAFQQAGGRLVEQCRVTSLVQGDLLEVDTSLGKLKARNAIYATHIPPGINLLHFRCAPYRSYVLGVRLKDEEYPRALGYDMNDPYHYYRTQSINGENFLVVGGEDHKTGHEANTEACFTRLESHVRTYFRVEEIAFRWSSQYFEPSDGLPYIGHLPGNGSNVLVGTGYGGNGMIYGTLAGIILSDLVISGESAYKSLLNPNRVKPVAGFSNFVKENADVVKEFVSGFFSSEKLTELSELARGEAKLVKYEGHSIGLFKDDLGQLHAVNPTCPHVKCAVGWNSVERSWDCPCHGSRFDTQGKLLTAPAVADLKKIDLQEISK